MLTRTGLLHEEHDNEIVNDLAIATMMNRAASRGEPTSTSAITKTFHDSFLPRIIHYMNEDQTQNPRQQQAYVASTVPTVGHYNK